jgi:uncharacterized protein involved in exopolysaccharide biosynthesis
VKYYETISELVGKQYEVAKLDEARQGAITQIVDVAVPPDNRSFPKRTISVVVALFFSFFVACVWCIFMGRMRIRNEDPEVRRRLDTLRATLRR